MYNSSDFGLSIKIFCTKFFDLQINLFLKLQRYIIQLFNFSNIRCAVAFTLAETLIVIGVIGIVSALTLPNLNSSTGEKEKVAKVKKIYQNLQDAFGRAEAVYGPFEEWIKSTDTTDELKAKRIGERITEFMKISKNCETASEQGCFTSGKAKMLTGDNSEEFDKGTGSYRIITADGMSIRFSGDNNSIDIIVDIDGPSKGSYTYGKDIFKFRINNDSQELVPFGDHLGVNFEALLDEIFTRGGCYSATWIIRYDNADYLQLKDKKGTCKNGNVMTEANPTCK
ncbi:type II secretion system protein [bacterium]|nr:type II secretion system protein [bacterium]